jgi:putative oxidoreductase
MKKTMEWFLAPPVDGPAATIILRVMAGSVFLWEGLMKFVFPNQGVGRFTKLGFPAPHFLATGDAWLEIIGGTLLIVGLLTRPVAILFVIEMVVAILSTKIPLYLGTYPLPLPPVPPQVGFWAVLHEIRSEYAQLVCSLFVVIVGPGRWSIEAWLQRKTMGIGRFVPDRVSQSTISNGLSSI